MNTIKDTQDIEALNLNEYRKAEAISLLQDMEKINAFRPCKLVYHEEQEGFELLLDNSNNITIRKDYRGQWNIYQRSHFDHVDNYKLNEIRKTIKEPNHFKVLSKKNIDAWVSYWQEVNTKVLEFDNACMIKIDCFLARLQGLAINWREDKKGGWIKSGDFEYSFSICDNGYIQEDIELSGEKNLDQFIKLSSV